MKKTFSIIIILASILSMFGCSKEQENEVKMNFYLSQPRDPGLVGWWVTIDSNQDSTFLNFDTNGIVKMNLRRDNSGALRGTPSEYWYTKDNICYTFLRNDSFKGYSLESHFKYEIRNDSLWIGEDYENYKMKLLAIKTSSVTIDRLINY